MDKPTHDAVMNSGAYQANINSATMYLVAACHGMSREAGWWHTIGGEPIDPHSPRVIPEKLMLCVTELSEAMEGHRKNLNDDKLPHRKMFEVELADAVIRVLDLAGACGLDLGGAIVEKLQFNAVREDHKPENRAKEGGKAY
ncbi:hypothetical protein [Bradyrhizobium sp.]|uniref:hypothetical protein n=1 Tax=Bradyrhizobium sp. TaxID=376 RepID=UPI0039E72A09